MQNSSYKDGEEANSECAQLKKALFFPQEKKSSKKRKTNTNNSCIYHSIAALKSVSTINQKPKSIK